MSRTPTTLVRELASLFQAWLNCADRPSDDPWRNNHRETIETLCDEYLPSGSGIDCGTKFDFDASKADRLVLTFSYHHMNEGGMYDGWTDHSLIITPSLAHGFNTRITGPNRNQVKDYFYDIYHEDLRQQVWCDEEGQYYSERYYKLGTSEPLRAKQEAN